DLGSREPARRLAKKNPDRDRRPGCDVFSSTSRQRENAIGLMLARTDTPLSDTEATVIAPDIRSYEDLLVALRQRCEQLDVAGEDLDRVAGWAEGLASKLLCLPCLKTLGLKTLEPMLLVMGCKLQLVVDPPAVEKYTARLVRRQNAGNAMPAIEKR